jgi:hypothetical protein
VAFVTASYLPELDPDDRLVVEPLERAGVAVAAAVWDDTAVDWASFDLAVVRSTWDYASRRDEFIAWAANVPRLANPADVVAWNTDKRYLGALAGAGVPVVPTVWVEPGQVWTPPDSGQWVVKPTVSNGSRDTGRYECVLPEHRALAAAHVARLQAAGRPVMIQPYVGSVDTYGETALLYVGGEYSHAIRKGPMLTGPDATPGERSGIEVISPRTPSSAERAVAEAALGAVPFPTDQLLYARVDLLDVPAAGPTVIEVELTEPSLFLGTAEGAAQRLADAIIRRLPS